jgi:hypothetical protein
LLTADYSKISQQNTAVSPVLIVLQEFAHTIDAVPAAPAALADAHVCAPASCPLYLSFRTLLI